MRAVECSGDMETERGHGAIHQVGVAVPRSYTAVFWSFSVVLSAVSDGYHHPRRTGSASGASYTLRRLKNEL